MNRHDWLLNQLFSLASWPALREENKDKLESGLMRQRAEILSFEDPCVCVCLLVCNPGQPELVK